MFNVRQHVHLITSNWSRLAISQRPTRAERKELPRPIPGILTTIAAPQLTHPRPLAVPGEVINGYIRCGACGRKRSELIKTLKQFQCKRCVSHTQRMGEAQ
jgi:hypothetical protein